MTGADHYFQIGFSAAAGSLGAGASVVAELAFHKNDFSAFIRTNDYSYNGSSTLATTVKVTGYITTTDGTTLVYGTEPL